MFLQRVTGNSYSLHAILKIRILAIAFAIHSIRPLQVLTIRHAIDATLCAFDRGAITIHATIDREW